jgi:hypothetical protein
MASKTKSNNYQRKSGTREAKGEKKKSITFSWIKLCKVQGQKIEEWEKHELMSPFVVRMQQIGQVESKVALSTQLIKLYTQIGGLPPNSKFTTPTHVNPAYWAVIHITQNSIEVVVGYLEDEVFYIVFLDRHHQFWPIDIQSKGKNKN